MKMSSLVRLNSIFMAKKLTIHEVYTKKIKNVKKLILYKIQIFYWKLHGCTERK